MTIQLIVEQPNSQEEEHDTKPGDALGKQADDEGEGDDKKDNTQEEPRYANVPEEIRSQGPEENREVRDSGEANDEEAELPNPTPSPSYFTQYRWMRDYMPHWQNTFASSRKSSGSITVYDISGLKRLHQWQDSQLTARTRVAEAEAVPATTGVPPFELPLEQSHAIFVQDLSPTLINVLGTTLEIGPEVFESHLVRSGYRGQGSYQDTDGRLWWTLHRGVAMHATLRWFSAVNRRPLPLSMKNREQLITDKLEWTEMEPPGEGKRVKIHYRLKTETNIFRREWPLGSTSPDTNPGDGSTSTFTSVAAWEEKVTCFRRRTITKDSEQMVFFFDPLPSMSQESGRGGNYLGEGGAPIHKTSILPFKRAIQRLPPLCSLSNHSQNRDRFRRYATFARSTMIDVENWLEFWRVRPKSRPQPSSVKEKAEQAGQKEKTAAGSGEGGGANEAGSAAQQGDTPSAILPLSALFQVILIDTMALLRHLHLTLDAITTDAMSERLMQERLSYWRTLLNWAQLELPRLSKSLSAFFAFATFEVPMPSTFDGNLAKLQKNIQEAVVRCDRTQEHLRAEMSLLESKRGIAQAENVTRLTELAFIFIPMSFAAALFSMQLQELQDAPPRAWMFAAAALGLVGLAYVLRLAQRSPTLNSRVRNLGRRIRMETHVPDGVAVPAHRAVGWAWKYGRGNRVVLFLLPGVGIYAALVALMWMYYAGDLSLKIAMTTLVTILFGAVMFVGCRLAFNKKSFSLPDFSRFFPQPRRRVQT
ncbi:hypothetical protein B0H63DRAFT_470835 [Podospora didyma]|uniref:Uncharacterized protein n=1 Tax=Podospora didyma TaxID=330526 RepID=A0AAE0U226_9PEZI|nr:hypothetical protein B0H63DRAFT_470835 [Podospora didyma]